MSDKPGSKPSTEKPAGKTVGSGATSAAKSKPTSDADESFDFLAAPQEDDEIGRLAHFRVLRVLGKGGMGTVFMAEDTRLHRIVALKVMLPSIAKKPVARDRFIREARATAAIEHDHIITIYEVNSDREVPYAAMQYLKGMTLDDWLRAGKKLNVPQVMRIGKEIAKGLSAAHARQLIHRDIKPSNIWLDAANKGRVKILDFGLARPTNEETHLTQEGMILGTPAYMSPEQARGQNVDERCDLFSLGCVLYRLCAGKLPFTGRDAMSVLLAITSDEPEDLAPLNADVPPALAKLIHQLLAKKPEDRPTSAKDVVQTIQNIERDWIAGGKTVSTKSLGGPASKEDLDPALQESAITELELVDTEISGVKPAPTKGRGWIFAGLAGAAFSVFSIVCCLGIAIATDSGEVKVVADGDEARAFVTEHGLTVTDHHKKTHTLKLTTQKLASGGYKVQTTGLPDRLQIKPVEFSLARGESQEIHIGPASPKGTKLTPPELVLFASDEARKFQRDWATYLKVDVVDGSSKIGPSLTLIPAGEFMMGSDDEKLNLHTNEIRKKFEKFLLPKDYDRRIDAEKPAHRVRISNPFYLSTHEVTYGNFMKFVIATKHLTEPEQSRRGGTTIDSGKESGRRPELNWKNLGGVGQTVDHPVCNITWKDAEAYCKWLSEKEKKTYRLPTEAEWEYACRAGTTTLWSFGEDAGKEAMAHMWFNFPGKPFKNIVSSHPVGKKEHNKFGLHDMHGNIAEMCTDYFDPANYGLVAKETPAIDPNGPAAVPGGMRVVRGGSFLETPYVARSAYRQGVDPGLGSVQVGFRVVCEIPLPLE